MKKTNIAILTIFTLVVSAIPLGFFIIAAPPLSELPDYEPLRFGEFKGKEVRNLELRYDSPMSGLKSSDTQGDDIKIMYWYDDSAMFYYTLYLTYYKRAVIGESCEIWVRCYVNNPNYPDGTFRLNYYYPDDERNPVIVTMEQLEYLAKEFDENIYPTVTDYYGDEDFHDGSNSVLADDLFEAGYISDPDTYYYDPDGKTIIMLSNIGDESYYDSTYPNYIAGFYWSYFETEFDRNIINIDAYDFVHRVGQDNNPDCPWWVPGDEDNRPNLYESLIAHEYQHLVHSDWFPGDATFMNEACSLFAEPICGYELDLNQVEWFLSTPDNSLTYWGEQTGYNILADYGAAFLWALYLTDHYGFYFLQDYVLANWYLEDDVWYYDPDFPTEAKARITELLPKCVNFDKVFHNWRLANLIHSNYYGSDKYNYVLDELRAFTGNANQFIPWNELEPLEIKKAEGKKIPWTTGVEAFGETLTLEDPPDAPLGWATGYYTLAPYSTEYISFPDLNGLNLFQFDGDDKAVVPLDRHDRWTYDEDTEEWYSGMYSLTNSLIAAPITLGDNPVLELTTYWDIEDEWDFAFVQVSTEGTWESTWTSLELEGVTTFVHDPAAHPDAIANLPGFYGWSGDYVTLTFDLSAYTGQEIYIGFRYVTDWAFEYEGWYLRDVIISDDTSTYSIKTDLAPVFPEFPEADFMVSIVTKYSMRGHDFYTVYDMHLNSKEAGLAFTYDTKKVETIVVISPINDVGYTDYKFKVSRGIGKHWMCM